MKKSVNLSIPIYFLLFFFPFILRLCLMLQTQYADGWDSYFYLIQVKSIIENGSMHSQDYSIIYFFNIVFYTFTKNYILAYKLTAASISGVLTISIFRLSTLIVCKKENNINFTAIAAALISVLSPSVIYFTLQFPKNLLGLSFFIFFFTLAKESYDQFIIDKKIYKNIIYAFIFFIASFFTHRMSAALSLLAIMLFIFLYFLQYRKKVIMIVSILSAFIILMLTLFLPGTLHFHDFERFKDLFILIPEFPPFEFMEILGFYKLTFIWKFEIVLFYFLILINIVIIILDKYFLKEKIFIDKIKRDVVLNVSLLCFLLTFPFFKINEANIGFRFYLASIVFSIVLVVPYLVYFKNKIIILSFVSILIILSIFTNLKFEKKLFNPPYESYDKLSEEIYIKLENTNYDLFIIHKGFAEIFTFKTGLDALPWQPSPKRYNYQRVWRIAYGFTKESIMSHISEKNTNDVISINESYIAIREDLWQEFIRKAEIGDEKLYLEISNWKNPSRIRPKFIKVRKKQFDNQ